MSSRLFGMLEKWNRLQTLIKVYKIHVYSTNANTMMSSRFVYTCLGLVRIYADAFISWLNNEYTRGMRNA